MSRRPRRADAGHRNLINATDLRTILVMQNIAKIVAQNQEFHRQAIKIAGVFQRQQPQLFTAIAAVRQAQANLAGIAGRLPAPVSSLPVKTKYISTGSQAEQRDALREKHWCYW